MYQDYRRSRSKRTLTAFPGAHDNAPAYAVYRSIYTYINEVFERNRKMDYDNDYCKIAAQMLYTEPGLLDYRLVEHLNEIAGLVSKVNHFLMNPQVIALAIVQWQGNKADDFTKPKT